MLPLTFTLLMLAVTRLAARRFECATPDWTKPGHFTSGLLGVALAALTAVALFTLLPNSGLPNLRFSLVAAITAAVAVALVHALNSSNPGARALWQTFMVALLLLSCALGVLAGPLLRQ